MLPQAAEPTQPLGNLVVVDLTRVISGAFLTLLFADFGAEVIKVEHPEGGDPLRTWSPGDTELWSKVYNRNKKSITLNLASVRGQELLRRLVQQADVLVENFRPGTLEKWGLAPAALLEVNPRLVVCRVSGFGQTGPYRDKPGFGTIVEAMTGFASLNGFPDTPPGLPPFPLADISAAMFGVVGVMVALHHRVQSGKGQVIDLDLFEPLFSMLGPLVAEYDVLGRVRKRIGNRSHNSAPRNTYRTKDGRWVAISAASAPTFARLCRAIEQPGLIADARFATNPDRLANAEALDERIQAFVGHHSLEEVVRIFDEHQVTGGPVYDVRDILDDPHFQARRSVIEVPDDKHGRLRMHNVVIRLSDSPGAVRWAGPAVGQNNAEVYQGRLGLSEQELGELAREKVV